MTSNLQEDEIKNSFRPEFINRIDDIVHFNDLNLNSIKIIVDIQLNLVSTSNSKNKLESIFINIQSKGNNLANGKKKVNSIS